MQELLWTAKFWLEGVVQCGLSVVGVATNSVSIYVLSRRELSNTFNQLLIALAIFDISYLVFMFLDSIGKRLKIVFRFRFLVTSLTWFGGQVFVPSVLEDFPSWYKLLTPHLLYPGKVSFFILELGFVYF